MDIGTFIIAVVGLLIAWRQLGKIQDQLKIAQRKAEQGSMQTQGEAQELAIEEYLSLKFPLDTI